MFISIIQTNDSGYLLTGVLDVTASNGEGNSKISATKHAGGDYWVIKLNALGEKQWSKFYGGTFTDTPYDAIQTEDNGYIVVGSSDSNDVDISNNKGSYDFWVIKISETGDLVWEKSFGGSGIEHGYGVIAARDGGVYIAGDTNSDDQDVGRAIGVTDAWLLKLDTDGNKEWEQTYGGSDFDSVVSIKSCQNGDLLLIGNTKSSDTAGMSIAGENDLWLLRCTPSGQVIWQKNFGGADIDFGFDAVEMRDGRILWVGETRSNDLPDLPSKGGGDLLLLELH